MQINYNRMKLHVISTAVVLFFLSGLGCSEKSDKVILTVTGPIPASKMGVTLVHEHVLVDFIGADSTGYYRWDREEAAGRIAPYLEELRELGVQTLIECTPAFLGRDPVLLRMLSKKTGMKLVTNTGYYGAHENRYIPEGFYHMTAQELSAIWIDEFRNGIEGTGIKPGFIKIAVDDADTLSPEHVKIVTAAAHTHNATGLVIASHTGPDNPAFAQIALLKSYGVDPSSFIWVHAQRGSLNGNLKAARQGTWISLDNVNPDKELASGETYSIGWYADRIASIKEAGLLNRVLISHDAGWYSPGEENGGDFRGYTGIFTSLLPALKERGFDQDDLDQLLIVNPREAFSLHLSL
jgi:phosphotriesterase-related protein